MISEALLGLVTWLFEAITNRLEVGTVELPGTVTVLTFVGRILGPINHWAPVHEAALAGVWVVTWYLPLALTYMLVSWVYRHIPFVGGG